MKAQAIHKGKSNLCGMIWPTVEISSKFQGLPATFSGVGRRSKEGFRVETDRETAGNTN